MRIILATVLCCAVVFSNVHADMLIMVTDPCESEKWDDLAYVASYSLHEPTIAVHHIKNYEVEETIGTAIKIFDELSQLDQEDSVLFVGVGIGNVCINLVSHIIDRFKNFSVMPRESDISREAPNTTEQMASSLQPFFDCNVQNVCQQLIKLLSHPRLRINIDAYRDVEYKCIQIGPPTAKRGIAPCENILSEILVFGTQSQYPEHLEPFGKFYTGDHPKIWHTLVSFYDEKTKIEKPAPYAMLMHHKALMMGMKAIRKELIEQCNAMINRITLQRPVKSKGHPAPPTREKNQEPDLRAACIKHQASKLPRKGLPPRHPQKKEGKKMSCFPFCWLLFCS
ncbi:hypothetical protein HOD08_02020 [bacterium]|mgnify:CR=1 FL=1|nr:hypothetical protein [bacterium]